MNSKLKAGFWLRADRDFWLIAEQTVVQLAAGLNIHLETTELRLSLAAEGILSRYFLLIIVEAGL